jgi:hypothetical protein
VLNTMVALCDFTEEIGAASHGRHSHSVRTTIGACSELYTVIAVIEHVPMEVRT